MRDTDQVRTERLRYHSFPLFERLVPLVGVESNGVRYVVSTRERIMGRAAFATGCGEREMRRRMLAVLERWGMTSLRGRTVMEVGANIGTDTVSLLAQYGVERVVAFEPDPENVRLLCANLALNGLSDRADVNEMALSDVDAALLLERSTDNCGDHRIRVRDARGPDLYDERDRSTVSVPARRVDSLVEDGELDPAAIDLVWMDAQGHEGHVLAGARKLIDAGTPMLTEYWPYGLTRCGGLDTFHSLVAGGYEEVVDLRSHRNDPPVTMPAGDVMQLVARYSPNSAAHTDLLLLPAGR